jgi:branched-chain amino acid transport system ATP-binding protein
MTPFLEVEGLETAYGRSQVLFGIDLAVAEGEVVGVMGKNGMGKTTTMRSIMGLTRPQRGRVRVGGVEVQHLPAFRIARAGLAIVPEGRQVFRNLTVREHLLMAESPRRSVGSDPWTTKKVYALFPRLAERERHFGTQLSGGEQQMLAIGRALMTNPRLVLFDEATEGLAPLVRHEIWGAIATLKERGCAIVIVDKNLSDVGRLAERMVVLEKGRVAWSGRSSTLCGDEALQRRYLGV